MPALRKCLKHPGAWLCAFGALLLAAAADSIRAPENQLSVPIYGGLVIGYRAVVRPLFGGVIRCRFRPSCSEYSLHAVRRYGIRPGLTLTWKRIQRCRQSVPFGTEDPIPTIN